MNNCESNTVLISNTYKKIAQTLLNLFAEFNSQNESLVTVLGNYSTDINTNKEGIVAVLDDYILYRSNCCFNIVSRIDEIIELFDKIACINPVENTTTIEETTTPIPETTTTPDPNICYTETIDEKGVYYPYTTTKFLGTDTGLVQVVINAYDIPNRFVIEFDGSTVIDTGYIGNPLFQSYLDAAVYLEGGVAGDITDVSTATLYFNKDSVVDFATIKVYSPLSNSRFQVTMGCPETVECLAIELEIVDIDFLTTTPEVTTTIDGTTTITEPTTTDAPNIYYLTDTNLGCGNLVGDTPYYADDIITKFYSDEAMTIVYSPGVGVIGWNENANMNASFAGDIDVDGNVSNISGC